MQVKIITGNTLAELEDCVNSFLESLDGEPRNIQFYLDNWSAVVEYENVCKGLCCDCKFWDDGNDSDSLIGLCQMHGGRKRFNQKGCKEFNDIRR